MEPRVEKGKGRAVDEPWHGAVYDFSERSIDRSYGDTYRPRSRKARPNSPQPSHKDSQSESPLANLPAQSTDDNGGATLFGQLKRRKPRRSTPALPVAYSRRAEDDDEDEDDPGHKGRIIPLSLTGSGAYDAIYVVEMSVGPEGQKRTLSLQVDSGSSDTWMVSNGCGSAACKDAKNAMYDPSGSRSTGKDFTIKYLKGEVSGPIVWDTVDLGGYTISSQAICAATNIVDEPLGPRFSGILGLALPLNSIISEQIGATTGNAPDGAPVVSNIFGLTPLSDAPAAHFISMSLSRPDSPPTPYPDGTAIPSLMGIGKHPKSLVPDPSKIEYSSVVSDSSGVLFWKANVQDITVWANGVENVIPLGRSLKGGIFPTAVVDSGVPVILTTSTLANAIYGVLGVNPGADGQYYVPCKTPLNMTIKLDDRTSIPLHPLDMTSMPASDNTAQFCIGMIQSADPAFNTPGSTIGDMILGVPFMRNVYTVMAYEPPNTNGLFNPFDPNVVSQTKRLNPRLGFLPLTDPTIALDEFNTVRVLNRALGPTTTGSESGSGAARKPSDGKMSVGIKVLIGISCFFGLCFALFGVRWLIMKRTWKKNNRALALAQERGLDCKGSLAHATERRENQGLLDQNTLRNTVSPIMLKERGTSDATLINGSAGDVDEFGIYKPYDPSNVNNAQSTDPWDPSTGLEWGNARDTLVGVGEPGKKRTPSPLPLLDRGVSNYSSFEAGVTIPTARSRPSLGNRASSFLSRASMARDHPSPAGERSSYFGRMADSPRAERGSWVEDPRDRAIIDGMKDNIPEPALEPWQEFGLGSPSTIEPPPPVLPRQRDRSQSPAVRRSRWSGSGGGTPPSEFPPSHHRRISSDEIPSTPSAPLLAHTREISEDPSDDLDLGEMGSRMSMAGVGTAARGSMIGSGLRNMSISSTGSTSAAEMAKMVSPLSPVLHGERSLPTIPQSAATSHDHSSS